MLTNSKKESLDLNNETQPSQRQLKIVIQDNLRGTITMNGAKVEMVPVRLEITGSTKKTVKSVYLHELNHKTTHLFKPFSEKDKIEIFFEKSQKSLILPEKMSGNLINFFKQYKPKDVPFYCCHDFAYEIKYTRENRRDESHANNSHWYDHAKKMTVGDVIVLFQENAADAYPTHSAIYISEDLHLSLFGVSGPLIVTTLSEIKKVYASPYHATLTAYVNYTPLLSMNKDLLDNNPSLNPSPFKLPKMLSLVPSDIQWFQKQVDLSPQLQQMKKNQHVFWDHFGLINAASRSDIAVQKTNTHGDDGFNILLFITFMLAVLSMRSRTDECDVMEKEVEPHDFSSESKPLSALQDDSHVFDLSTLPRFPCDSERITTRNDSIYSLSVDAIRHAISPYSCPIFVITTAGELIIQISDDHADLGQGKPVLAAGAIELKHINGQNEIVSIYDRSGAYMLHAFLANDYFENTAHFPIFIESMFIKAGFLEAKGKFELLYERESEDALKEEWYASSTPNWPLKQLFSSKISTDFPFNAEEIAQIRLAHFFDCYRSTNKNVYLTQFSSQELQSFINNKWLFAFDDLYVLKLSHKVSLYRERAFEYLNKISATFEIANADHRLGAVLAAITNHGDLEQLFSAQHDSPSKRRLFKIVNKENTVKFQYTEELNYEHNQTYFHLSSTSQPVQLPMLDVSSLPRFSCDAGRHTAIARDRDSLTLEQIKNYSSDHSHRFIYVITPRGELRIDSYSEIPGGGLIQHEHLGQNQPVLAAGEITFVRKHGEIISLTVNDQSGGYMAGSYTLDPVNHQQRIQHFPALIEAVFLEATGLPVTFVPFINTEDKINHSKKTMACDEGIPLDPKISASIRDIYKSLFDAFSRSLLTTQTTLNALESLPNLTVIEPDVESPEPIQAAPIVGNSNLKQTRIDITNLSSDLFSPEEQLQIKLFRLFQDKKSFSTYADFIDYFS